jgi:hypothetical protein
MQTNPDGRGDPLKACVKAAGADGETGQELKKRIHSCEYWFKYSAHSWQKGGWDRDAGTVVFCLFVLMMIGCVPCLWWVYSVRKESAVEDEKRHQEEMLLRARVARGLPPNVQHAQPAGI